MKYCREVLFLLMLFIFGCSSNSIIKSKDFDTRSKKDWSQWVIFPIKIQSDQLATIRNDYLMYRIKKDGYNTNYNAYKYYLQFKNNRDDLVKIKYKMFSKFESCDDLDLLIGPNKKSQTIAHLFDTNAQLFLHIKDYSKVENSEFFLGKVD